MLLAYLPVVVAAAAGLSAPAAETGVRPVQIELEGPEGCSGAEAFFASLRSRTDRVRRAEGKEPRTTLQVRLSRAHGQVVGELKMVDDRGGTDSRKVQGATCEEVVGALSLTAALALDPSALLSAPVTPSGAGPSASGPATASGTDGSPADASAAGAGPSAGTSAPRTAAAAPEKPAEASAMATVEEAPPSPPRPVPAVELALGALGLRVLAGDFSTGAALAVRKTLGHDGVLRPTLGLAIAYLRNDVLRSPPAAQAGLAVLGATVCPIRVTASILTAEPCALLLGGWLSAKGREVAHPSTVDRLWLSAGGTLRVAAFLGRGVSLELEGGISFPLLKRRFFVTVPDNVVTETPTISPVVGIGLTYGF